jgi:TRAP-type mannitol/chloroaromatic compound transport system permease large subunit
MGLGMFFGYLAFLAPGQHWWQNQIFDLMVQRTYGVMTNDTLLSVPLFVFMGYVMERAALVDRMFHSVQLAFRRVPASLAVTTLLVCAFWGIASGIVGAVVVLMGVIALRPMLKAGYDSRLASGAIAAGGTLGILIPPSVMLIVYAAVAGQSIVKLYAAAMLPGFFLTFLYLAYIVGWALLNPKIAPKLAMDQYRLPVPPWLERLQQNRLGSVVPGVIGSLFRPRALHTARTEDGHPLTYGVLVKNVLALLVPVALAAGTFGATWWYVTVYNAPSAVASGGGPSRPAAKAAPVAPALATTPAAPTAQTDEAPQELGGSTEVESDEPERSPDAPLEEVGTGATARAAAPAAGRVPAHFYQWFWGLAGFSALLLLVYFSRMDGEQLEILKELIASVVPLAVLTIVVLAVILFGICTATESAAIGALGALYLAVMSKYPREVWWWSLVGALVGLGLGWYEREPLSSMLVAAAIAGTFLGTVVPGLRHLRDSSELRENLKQSTFLTAKTTAMVCWLFVGSALFSAVFALHGGQGLIERWVLGMNLSPVGFLIISQLIIFLLGWPLEWTEIIVIFCPIFIPLLAHFQVDPLLFGTMVAVNLQAAFLSPPVAMSAFYLKGVAPKHVTLNQIFAGMMPYMLIVIVCLAFMYIWPGMTLWLPEFLYGG